MATVYLAHDLRHDRSVAVKILNSNLAATIGTDRFQREIQIAARLTHPHIVPLHDSGIADGQLYYVMPYVAGESLRGRLQREKSLPLDEAMRITCDIASALGYAHHQGLIHRDIKPENILLSEGIALVSDFGIARAITSDGSPALTMTGTTLGTPAYMSPEQIEGANEIDGRADLYSLGCVLYEMLAGRPPFTGAPHSLAHQHLLTEPRSITDFRPDIPVNVVAAITKALAKRPSDRFATTAHFVEAIQSTSTAAATLIRECDPTARKVGDSSAVPNNLPKERTRFIGREKELAQCMDLLRAARLLTLTGLGGGGKTRLSIKLAERAADLYPDGVWFVDLSSLNDGTRVVDTVAQVLGLHQAADKDLVRLLAAHIADKRMLIVLDNCEHLIDSCVALVDELLNIGGETRILATSREALGVPGERVFPLRPLDVPSSDALRDAIAVEASDAVRLFVDRAQIAQTSFKITEENILDVAEICRHLDGIPLAIELAAARVKVLSVSQIRGKLNDRFRLLTSGGRTALGRHQTLQATIQWSYEQLSADEQHLLHSLSVFAGGWSLELAVSLMGCQKDEFEILDLLTHLIDKSLVVVETEQQGQRRYGLLETVRQYALERLTEAGDADTVREKHLKVFLDLAERGYSERINREQEWATTLETENDNLRAALEFAQTVDLERYLKLVGALAWFWQVRSHLREGSEHMTAALALTTPQPARPARARALWGAAHMLTWQGDPVKAQSLMDEALCMWRELDDAKEIAFALEGIGWAQFLAGEDEAAKTTFEEGLRLQRAEGDAYSINRAMVGMAQVLVALSEVEEARPMALEIIEFSKAHTDKRNEHFGWHFLADCALIEGKCEESLDLYKRSLLLAQELGDQIETSFEVQGVAMSLSGLGEAEQALMLASAAKAEWDRIGADIHISFWDELLDRYIGTAKKTLSDEARLLTINRGRALSFNDAVTLALNA